MEQKPTGTRNRLTLYLLALVTVLPVVLAWVIYYGFPNVAQYLGSGVHGTLVHPVRDLNSYTIKAAARGEPIGANTWKRKWTYVYIDQPQCDKLCQRHLYIQRQVHVGQGREAQRVQRVFVVLEPRPSAHLTEILKDYPHVDVVYLAPENAREFLKQFEIPGTSPVEKAQRIYLVDPRGRLMMYYEPDREFEKKPHEFPRKLFKDLKKILKDSMIG